TSLPAPKLLGYDEEGNRIEQFGEQYDNLIEKRKEFIREAEAQNDDIARSLVPDLTEFTADDAGIDRAALEWWNEYKLTVDEASAVTRDSVRGHQEAGEA